MRTILTALLLTIASQAGAECGYFCNPYFWKLANVSDVQAKLDAGADVMARDANGSTPLHSAAYWGFPATIQALLDAGADVMTRNANGSTPLHMAAYQGTAANIQALLDAGADVMARDANGSTPLHSAAYQGTAANIQALLDAGADVMARDKDGGTPLHYAADWFSTANLGVIQALLDAGADAKATNQLGSTPWDLAQDNEKLKGSEAYWVLADASLSCSRLCDVSWWENASSIDLQAQLDAGAFTKLTDSERATTWSLAEKSSLKGTKGYWALNDAQYN